MEAELIESVAISIVAAAVMAYLSHRLRQPLILGYILAGILIGPELGLGGRQVRRAGIATKTCHPRHRTIQP